MSGNIRRLGAYCGRRRLLLASFVGSRLIVVLVAYLTLQTVGADQVHRLVDAWEHGPQAGIRLLTGQEAVRASEAFDPRTDPLLLLQAWDGSWYREIAEQGYGTDSPQETQRFRFFPLWPLLWAGATRLLFWIPTVAVGVALAHLLTLAGALRLRTFLLRETGSEALAERAGAALVLFPSSYVLSMTYAEPLFLLLTVLYLDFLRRGNHWRAAGAGALAALARGPGVILAIAALIEIGSRLRQRRLIAAVPGSGSARVSGAALATAGPVAGLGAYLAYVWARTGDPLTAFRLHLAEEALKGDPSFFLVEIIERIADAAATGIGQDTIRAAVLIAAMAALIAGIRTLPASMTVFGLVMLATVSSAQNLAGVDRYVLAAIPLFWVLGRAGDQSWARGVYLSVAPALMGVLALLAFSGIWVP